jgi:hypothetical protein
LLRRKTISGYAWDSREAPMVHSAGSCVIFTSRALADPHLARIADVRTKPDAPSRAELDVEHEWVVLALPGERWGAHDLFLRRLVDSLDAAPHDARAVAVRSIQTGGRRATA